MLGPHLCLACGVGAEVPRVSQALAPRHRAEVSPPTNQAAFHDGVVHRQGLAHGLLWGLRVEMPRAASRGLNQAVQVVYLDGIMGEAYPWCLEPMDPAHLRPGPCVLALGHAVGVVQHGVQKRADAVGVQVLGYIEPPAQ